MRRRGGRQTAPLALITQRRRGHSGPRGTPQRPLRWTPLWPNGPFHRAQVRSRRGLLPVGRRDTEGRTGLFIGLLPRDLGREEERLARAYRVGRTGERMALGRSGIWSLGTTPYPNSAGSSRCVAPRRGGPGFGADVLLRPVGPSYACFGRRARGTVASIALPAARHATHSSLYCGFRCPAMVSHPRSAANLHSSFGERLVACLA